MSKTGNRDLKNHAYQIMKERLINCTYEPDSFIDESQLATDLGLSRIFVREAINRLESEGLVKVMPKKGILVSNIQLSDALQIFQARIEIEPVALGMAAPHLPTEKLLHFRNTFIQDFPNIQNAFRLDTAMHLFIVEYCGNRYIIDMMHKLFDDDTKVVIASKQNRAQIHDARLEHLDTISTLIDKNYEKTAILMKTHIETCRRAALDYFYSMESYNTISPRTYENHLKVS